MIQFNLLPDIKLEYIRAARVKRLVITISLLVIIVVVALVGLISTSVLVFQRNHLGNLNEDISRLSQELESTDDIDKILTIQNQLNSLPALHEDKPQASRLFSYLTQLTPSVVTLSQVNIDFTEGTADVNGEGDALSSINQFVDTLKFTKYTVEGDDEQLFAFSEVVLENFSRSEKINYSISFKFEPTIFDGTEKVKLIIPNITSTRSATEKPNAVFQEEGSNQ